MILLFVLCSAVKHMNFSIVSWFCLKFTQNVNYIRLVTEIAGIVLPQSAMFLTQMPNFLNITFEI